MRGSRGGVSYPLVCFPLNTPSRVFSTYQSCYPGAGPGGAFVSFHPPGLSNHTYNPQEAKMKMKMLSLQRPQRVWYELPFDDDGREEEEEEER